MFNKLPPITIDGNNFLTDLDSMKLSLYDDNSNVSTPIANDKFVRIGHSATYNNTNIHTRVVFLSNT